jgi:glycosyltransferase involved in cell wall biosynthesis
MKRILLIHAGMIPHYRVPIYGYLNEYFKKYGLDLIVTSESIQCDDLKAIGFEYHKLHFSLPDICKLVIYKKIDIIIDYMELKNWYLFPTYFIVKGFLGRKIIYWGQGRDLLDSGNRLKNLAYAIELAMSDAIVLYAEHLKKYVSNRYCHKIFVANNTLCFTYKGLSEGKTRNNILAQFGILTKRNVICIGRIQKRKRIDNLVEAFRYMNRPDIGLILVGPDEGGILDQVDDKNIYKLGPIYGDRRFDLVAAADVYCLPGAVGLSIIDAFACGIPFVTEEGDESAEIGYLKNGVNGYIVPRGDTMQMSQKLQLLLDDEVLRKCFSDSAKRQFVENATMDKMCAGFRDAIFHAIRKSGVVKS